MDKRQIGSEHLHDNPLQRVTLTSTLQATAFSLLETKVCLLFSYSELNEGLILQLISIPFNHHQ